MSAYLIADVKVHDPRTYEEYRKLVGSAVQKYGGTFLARGGKVELLEGQWNPARLVILAFDSAEKARQFYHSDEYGAAKAIRQKASTANFIMVEGV